MQMKYSGRKTETLAEPMTDRYVVVRNGSRVSDEEYTTRDEAQPELDHWKRVIKRWPDGSKLEILDLSKRNNK
jgi:hypothetical protein